MELGSLIIGLGGILVAALSLFLSYKSRTAAFREQLYVKQLEAYSEAIHAMDSLDEDIRTLVYYIENSEDKKEHLAELVDQAIAQEKALSDAGSRNSLFLTSRITDKFVKYFSAVNEILEIAQANESGEKGKIDMEKYGRIRDEVLQSARKDLGTDPLTEETLKSIGKYR